ncbi:DUF6543 domain-containing protein [Burkholderia sp. BDU5]|uniref:DUF6543 domain-containing protein n=1 Tax=Burkholderia sp. BDU5 TaxID=1385590 RepID=UPI000B136CEE|nr:DUF6543 domain-containing protein [Burkholderia sp. BDU5]
MKITPSISSRSFHHEREQRNSLSEREAGGAVTNVPKYEPEQSGTEASSGSTELDNRRRSVSTVDAIKPRQAPSAQRPEEQDAKAASLADFQDFVQREAKRLIKEKFAGQNLDPGQVYVNRRDPVTGRVTVSRTLTEELLHAIRDGTPTYDLNNAGLFRSPNWNDADRIARQSSRGPSNALIDIEDYVAPRLLNDPTRGSLETRYQAHVRTRTEQRLYPNATERDLGPLRQYEAQRNSDGAAVDRLMADVAPEAHVRQRIRQYMEQQGGTPVDPDRVRIRVESRASGRTTSTELSLTEAVLLGPYANGTTFTLGTPSESAAGNTTALTPAFLKRMLGELDVRPGYIETLRQRYNTASAQSALNDALASRTQHAAYSAKLKGEITSADYELIQRVQNGSGEANSGKRVELGGVTMFGGDQLRDIQVYRETDPHTQSERYVMYGPGAPDKEFYAANTPYQLSQMIAGWAATEAGRRYLTDQLDPSNRQKGEQFFGQIAQMPSEWKGGLGEGASVSWKSFGDGGYRAQLGAVAAEKGRASVAEAERVLLPPWYAGATPKERTQFNSLDAAARSALQAYQGLRQPEPFHEFAQREVGKWLNERLREQGVKENIDPNTVRVDLDGTGQKVMTLTDLVTFGYRDHRGDIAKTMRFSSTIGQDLSGLESDAMRGYIATKPRNAYLGEQYINKVTVDFLSEGPALDERRALYQSSAQSSMARDALVSKLKNEITETQYRTVQAEINRLSDPDSATVGDRREKSERGTRGIYEFTLNGKVARGIYVFRSSQLGKSDDANLVYTPGAPDGIAFRSIGELRSLFGDGKNREMSRYLYGRFGTADQNSESIGKFFDDLHRNIKVSAKPAYGNRLTDGFESEYDKGIQQLTGNVDAITESRKEVIQSVAKEVWDGIKLAATIATLPFPPASAFVGGILAAEGLYNGIRAYRDGDRSAALEHFMSASWDLAGAAGDLLGGGLKGAKAGVKLLDQVPVKRFSGTAASSTAASASSAATHSAAAAKAPSVDSALHAPLPSGTQTIRTDGYMKDVVEIQQPGAPSRYFVRDGNGYLEVKPDNDNFTLRLVDPRKRAQQMYFEPIRKNEQGQWVYNPNVGVRGGGRDELAARLSTLPSRIQTEGIANSDAFDRLRPELASYLSADANQQVFTRLVDLSVAQGRLSLADRAQAMSASTAYERARTFLSSFHSRNGNGVDAFPDLLSEAVRNGERARSAPAAVRNLVAQERSALAALPASFTASGAFDRAGLTQHRQELVRLLSADSNRGVYERFVDILVANGGLSVADQVELGGSLLTPYERASRLLDRVLSRRGERGLASLPAELQQAVSRTPGATAADGPLALLATQESERLAGVPQRIRAEGIANGAAFTRLRPELASYLSADANQAVFTRLLDLSAAESRLSLADRARTMAASTPYERARIFLDSFLSKNGDGASAFPDLLSEAVRNGDRIRSAPAAIDRLIAREQQTLAAWPARLTAGAPLNSQTFAQHQNEIATILATGGNQDIFTRLVDLSVAQGRLSLADRAQAMSASTAYERARTFLSSFHSRNGNGVDAFPDLLSEAVRNGERARSAPAAVRNLVAQERSALAALPASFTASGAFDRAGLTQHRQELVRLLSADSNRGVYERFVDILVANGGLSVADQVELGGSLLTPYERASRLLDRVLSRRGERGLASLPAELQQAVSFVRWSENVPADVLRRLG